jgi:hypothetical protein
MKKFIFLTVLTFLGTALAFMLSFQPANNAYAADNCYNCGSGSAGGINQCKYHGSESFEQRKKCEAAGCKVTGTSSCSTAANVKVIDPN